MASKKRLGAGLSALAGASLLLAGPALADTQPTISQETTLRPDLLSAQIVPGSDNLVDYCYDKSIQVLPGVTANRFHLRPYAEGSALFGLNNDAVWGVSGTNSLPGGEQLANSIVGTTNGPGGTASCVRVSFANNANIASAHYTQAETEPNVVGKFDNTTSQYANLGDSVALGGSDQVVPEPNPGTTPGPTAPSMAPNMSNFTLIRKDPAAGRLTYVITFDKALDVNYTQFAFDYILYNDNGTRTQAVAGTAAECPGGYYNNGGGNTSQSVCVTFPVTPAAVNDTFPRVAAIQGAVRSQLSGIFSASDSDGYAVSQSPNLIRVQQVDPNNGNLWDFYFSKSVSVVGAQPPTAPNFALTNVGAGIATPHDFYLVGEGGTRLIFADQTTITQNNDTRVRVRFPKQPHFAPEEIVRGGVDDGAVKTEGEPSTAQFLNPIEVAPAILANAAAPTTIGRYPVGSSLAGFSAAPDLVDASFDINTGRATFTFDQRVNYFTPPNPAAYKIDYHYAGTNMGEAELTGVQYLGQGPGNNEKQVVVQMQALSPTPAPTIDGGHILAVWTAATPANALAIGGAAAPSVAAQSFAPDPLVTTSFSVFQIGTLAADPAQANAFAAAGLPLASPSTPVTPNPTAPGPTTPGPAASTGAPAPGPAAVTPVTTTTKVTATKKKPTKKAKKHKKKSKKKKKSKRVALLGKKH